MKGRPNHSKPLILVLLAGFALVSLGLDACGDSTVADAPYGYGTPPAVNKGPAYEVTTAKLGDLGTILVDGQGFTLYAFAPDHQSSYSTCIGACAAAWPPVVLPSAVSAPVAGPGVDRSLLGVTTRPDGAEQVTYNGWPVYRWEDDIQPGLATGQGIYDLGGYWYAMSPDGSLNLNQNPSGFD